MSKLKHTPGPWRAAIGYNGAERRYYLVKDEAQDGIYMGNEADTKLAAAAPEMLETLIKQYEKICLVCNYNLSCNINPCERKKKLQSIIEKATRLPIEEVLK